MLVLATCQQNINNENNNLNISNTKLINDFYNSYDYFNKLSGIKIMHLNVQIIRNKIN